MKDDSVAAKEAVRRQFSASAEAYRDAALFARGSDLPALLAAAELSGEEELLDVGTGPGHAALAFAPRVRRVVGVDLTPAMVRLAAEFAKERGVANAAFAVADAEALPFPAGRFDVVVCRFAAHHFQDFPLAIQEMARVLRPGGRLYSVDQCAPEAAAADDFVNRLDRLRDPSHVRDRTEREWLDALTRAGLTVDWLERWDLPLDLTDWLQRARTPEEQAQEVRSLLASAPVSLVQTFRITRAGDGQVASFTVPCLSLGCRRR